MKIEYATSIKYGNYKHCRANADKIASMVKKCWAKLSAGIDFPADVTVHIRPIKGNVVGRANYNKHRIEIDPRKNDMREVFTTVAHELCHFEQQKQGRLQWLYPNKVWMGTAYRRATTYKRYLALPWEIEAREYGERFAKEIYDVEYGN